MLGDADINAVSDKGDTALHEAVRIGSIELVKFLLAKGAKVDHAVGGSLTPLHEAAPGGRADLVMLLIGEGADVNAKTDDAYTPLHAAAEHEHTAVAELLIAKGANVDTQSDDGSTPLFGAIVADQEVAELAIAKRLPENNLVKVTGRETSCRSILHGRDPGSIVAEPTQHCSL